MQSGLDSTSSFEIASILKELSKRGRTIICTMHQPSQDIFEMFDKVTLLAGGRVVYFGSASEVLNYFSPYEGIAFSKINNSAECIINVAGFLYIIPNEKSLILTML